jgi:NADH:ubiquinone oxidoreductase subunit F (NADH-binding)
MTPEEVPDFIQAIMSEGVDKKRALFRTDSEYILLNGESYRYISGAIPEAFKGIPEYSEISSLKKQLKVVLRNSSHINPESIEEYIAKGGYGSLLKVFQMNPEEVIEEVTRAGLRGRSGGGFLTGSKWLSCRKAEGAVKYVLCNASEGDPGIGMHKSLLESDPHSILEGLIIGAYAIGAQEGYIYISSGYPLGVKRMEKAVEDARACGLLGKNIMNSGFGFDVTVKEGGGAYVCGESTALMASIEGRMGEPKPKYIHTAEKGLWDSPTDLNNLETWANVPVIISKGAKWYAQIGTEKSKGTKVISLSGNINDPCLVEVPMGTPLRDIIEMGNGMAKNRKLKAIQIGGPAGGVLPAESSTLPLDFDELSKAGSNLGSGGLIVMDERACMVEITKYFLTFLKEESCGKCVPCREGLKKLIELMERMSMGIGTKEDLELMEELSAAMEKGSLCDLGKTAPHIFTSTLRYFKGEYEAHMDGKCPAGVCKDLIFYSVDSSICTVCGACMRVCPVDAVVGEEKKVPSIDLKKCIKCGACVEVCEVEAIKA